MMEVVPGWTMDVTRGPDWLFVRFQVEEPQWGNVEGLAEAVWELLQQHLAHRLVLELDQLDFLSSALMGELVRLYKRIQSQGGLMRLSGLTAQGRETLRLTRLDRCFPYYRTREDAIKGNCGGEWH